MIFVDCFPAPRKRWCTACFPERYSIVFPSARTLHFPSVFPQSYQRWMQWKDDVCWLFSCSTKTLVYSFFPERFSIVFPSARMLHFSSVSTQNHEQWRPWKRVARPLFFLLYGNGSEQLALFTRMFFCSFRERASAAFSKRFHAQLLMVNVKKIWCSSIIFLLHGNANE